jgi:hypothetical protein
VSHDRAGKTTRPGRRDKSPAEKTNRDVEENEQDTAASSDAPASEAPVDTGPDLPRGNEGPLALAPAEYEFDINPPDAEAQFDGDGVIVTDVDGRRRATIAEPDGLKSYRVVVRRMGYEMQEVLLLSKPGERRTVVVSLQAEIVPPAKNKEPRGDQPAALPPQGVPPAFEVIWVRDRAGSVVPWDLSLDLDEREYHLRNEKHVREGLRPACVAGYHDERGGRRRRLAIGLVRRDGGGVADRGIVVRVGPDGDANHRVAAAERVAVAEVGRRHAPAVDERAVGASGVHQPAVRRIDFDHEVDAGELLVLLRQAEMGVARATDDEAVVLAEGEGFAAVRSVGDG